jgi:hypothetical protein
MPFLLDGNTLSRPKTFKREPLEIAEDFTSVTGKEGRDRVLRKEVFTLGWETLSSSEVSVLLGIVAKNTPVTFSVSDRNLTINEINVLVTIESVKYVIPGESYLAEVEIELTQIE